MEPIFHCSGFSSKRDYLCSNLNDHKLNMKTQRCSCGRAISYFCEPCKAVCSHSTYYRKHSSCSVIKPRAIRKVMPVTKYLIEHSFLSLSPTKYSLFDESD